MNNVVLGHGASSEEFRDCLVVGDEAIAESDGSVRVGHTLFGRSIPKWVRRGIKQNPELVEWLVRALVTQREGV